MNAAIAFDPGPTAQVVLLFHANEGVAFISASAHSCLAPFQMAFGCTSKAVPTMNPSPSHFWLQEDFRNFWDACPWEEDLQYAQQVWAGTLLLLVRAMPALWSPLMWFEHAVVTREGHACATVSTDVVGTYQM